MLRQVLGIFSAFSPVVSLLVDALIPALQMIIDLTKILVPIIKILFTAIATLLTPAMKIFAFIFEKISELVVFMSDKITPIINVLSGFMGRINKRVIDFFISEKESETASGNITAPNATQEESKRVLQGEGTITVKAEPGTAVTNVKSDISGVDMAMAGVN